MQTRPAATLTATRLTATRLTAVGLAAADLAGVGSIAVGLTATEEARDRLAERAQTGCHLVACAGRAGHREDRRDQPLGLIPRRSRHDSPSLAYPD